MKYTMLFAALWWSYCLAAQTLYNFVPGSGSWTDPASWNPIRVSPKTDDILQFNTNAIVTGMPVSESIGSISILNMAQVRISASSPVNLQVGNTGIPAPHMFVEAGAVLELAGAFDIHLLVTEGCKGQVRGTIRVSGAPHRLEATDSASVNFETGARFISASGFTGNAFGTLHLNSIVFKNGSAYQSQDGGNPFGAAAPFSVTIFENGSRYYQQQAIGLSLGGRTYGYLQTEANINLSLFGSVNDVVIKNDFIVNQGYFIFHPNTVHAGSFKIYGSIVQNGSSVLDIGNINMTGTVQLLGNNPEIGAGDGTGSCGFQNLFVDCAGSASVNRRVLVNGKLGLLRGNIITDSVHLLALGKNATIVSPVNAYGNSNEGWEQSFVDGPIQMNIFGTEKKMAPVGQSGVFAPLGIVRTNSDSASYIVQYFNRPFQDILSVNNPPLDHVSHVEYWKIACEDPDDAAKITLSWRPTSFVGSTPIERNDLAVAHYHDFGFGLKWNQEGINPTVIGDNNYGYLSSDNYVVAFSEFTLASRSRFNTLPLTNVAIGARESDGIVTINWNRQPGLNYELERRMGRSSDLMTKPMHSLAHEWRDTLPEPGDYFYRIGARNEAGGRIFSPEVRIRYGGNHVFSLYPNPCNNILFIIFSSPSSRGTLELVNSNGQLLQTLSLAEKAINTNCLKKGKYYIRYRDLDKVVTKAFFRL